MLRFGHHKNGTKTSFRADVHLIQRSAQPGVEHCGITEGRHHAEPAEAARRIRFFTRIRQEVIQPAGEVLDIGMLDREQPWLKPTVGSGHIHLDAHHFHQRDSFFRARNHNRIGAIVHRQCNTCEESTTGRICGQTDHTTDRGSRKLTGLRSQVTHQRAEGSGINMVQHHHIDRHRRGHRYAVQKFNKRLDGLHVGPR